MKILRTILAVLILLVIVCIFIAGGLIYFIDPNKVRPIIITEIEKKTGYHLTIDGKVSWSFYPTFGVKIDRMIFTAPKQKAPFIDLRDVTIATEFMQVIRGQNQLQGNVRIANVELAKMQLQNVKIGLHWQEKQLRLQPITAVLYQGTLTGNATGTNLSQVPQWSWDVQTKNVAVKPLLNDVNGKNSKIQIDGRGDFTVQATTQGKTRDEVLRNLNGSGMLLMQNGIIQGVDINYLIQSADALLNRETVSAANTNQTNFASLAGSYTLKNGVASSSNILLTAKDFLASAQGNVNFLAETINMQLQVKPQAQIRTQWVLPLEVTGKVNQPQVRVDLSELQKAITQEQINNVKEKVREEINKLPEKAEQYLQKFLGQ